MTATALSTPDLSVSPSSYKSMSLCLQDLQALPLEVRPDQVRICFGATPAYTIHVDEGVEQVNPAFRSTPKTLASDLTVFFEYLVYSELEAARSKLVSQIVFQRDSAGKVITDKLLDIFSYVSATVAA